MDKLQAEALVAKLKAIREASPCSDAHGPLLITPAGNLEVRDLAYVADCIAFASNVAHLDPKGNPALGVVVDHARAALGIFSP